jgi:uncharacterized protein DUF2784
MWVVRRLSEGIGIMLYRLLADFVIVIHCVIAWFLLFGAFLARQQPWVALLHVPLAIWVSAAFIMGWTCPLTPLENRLRKAAGELGYDGGFIEHYFRMSPPPDAPPTKNRRRINVILGVFCILLSIVPHVANLEKYHDAIWPPHFKSPNALSAP